MDEVRALVLVAGLEVRELAGLVAVSRGSAKVTVKEPFSIEAIADELG